jgi:hypothetical protein
VLVMNLADLAEMALDANPATAVDWGSGHWLRYENVLNVEGDVGGVDCSFQPFVATQAGAAPPATAATCRAATPPPPPPPPPSGSDGGGGGGTLGLATLLMLLLLAAVSRASIRQTQRSPNRRT